MTREFNNLIFSNHAQKRLKKRKITHEMIFLTLQKPEKQLPEENGNKRFTRTLHGRNVHVIAHYLPDEKKWLIVSAWVRGEDDPKPLWMQILQLPYRLYRLLRRHHK